MTGWVLKLACTRAEAEALAHAPDDWADLQDPPTLMVDEPDPSRPEDWTLSAYFTRMPDPATLARVRALAPSAPEAQLEPLPDADWVTLSQQGLAPVRAGRLVAHTKEHAGARRPGDIGLAIDAGLAFGTGQHMTTHGCLAALWALRRTHDFANIADLGTGTGILALAAARLWPRARTIATDIDPVAVGVARANLARNRLLAGRIAGRVELVTAADMSHRRLAERAPFDLILANILAGPLIAMARPVAAALAPGGMLVLAGLLATQKGAVTRAYRSQGLVPARRTWRRHQAGDWPTLILTRPVSG